MRDLGDPAWYPRGRQPGPPAPAAPAARLAGRRLLTALLMASVAAAAYLPFRHIQDYFFTGADTFSLIETGRVESWRDLGNVLSRPMMGGTPFHGRFYRPVSSLSFGLDHAAGGLEPAGYHRTDLALHVLVALLVFLLALELSGGSLPLSWGAALFFTLHPGLREVVPVVARRQDLLATLFLGASLLLFWRHRIFPPGRNLLAGSLLCYGLALGSKEVAIVLPLLLVSSLVVLAPPLGGLPLRQALKGTGPHLLLTLVFLVWRTYVLGGLGGYPPPTGLSHVVVRMARVLRDYFRDLFYPADFLHLTAPGMALPRDHPLLVSLAGVLLLCGSLVLWRGRLGRMLQQAGSGWDRARPWLGLLVLVSMLGTLLSPLLLPGIDEMVVRAYQGHGPGWLEADMEGREELPLESYRKRAREAYRGGILLLLASSLGLLAAITQRGRIRTLLHHTPSGRPIGFCALWLLAPLGVFLPTLTFSHWSSYLSLLPLSILLALMLGMGRAPSRAAPGQEPEKGPLRSLLGPRPAVLLATAGMLVSLSAFSPLLHPRREWGEIADLRRHFLVRLSRQTRGLPAGSTLHLSGLPDRSTVPGRGAGGIRSAAYFSPWGIESWLRLTQPGRSIRVVIHRDAAPPPALPADGELWLHHGDPVP